MTCDTAERARECLCNYRYSPEQPHELECPKHEYPGKSFFGANNRNIKRAEENHMMECGHPKRFWYATTKEKETGLDNGVCAACAVDRQRRGPATIQAEARLEEAKWWHENFPPDGMHVEGHSKAYIRIAALAQALQPEEKEGDH